MLKYYVWLQCYPALRGIFHTLWYVRPIPSKIQNIQNSRTESQIKLWCCICFRKHRGSKKSKKHYFSLSSKKYLSSCLQTFPQITKDQSKTHKRVTVRHTLVRKPSPLQPRPPHAAPPHAAPPLQGSEWPSTWHTQRAAAWAASIFLTRQEHSCRRCLSVWGPAECLGSYPTEIHLCSP